MLKQMRFAVLLVLFLYALVASCQRKPFTLADDIGVAHFGDPYRAKVDPFLCSPDGIYVAVVTERGRIEINKTESTVWIYRNGDIRQALSTKNDQPLLPYWKFESSEYGQGSNITHLRWLSDSSGLAFLRKTSTGSDQLFLADVTTKRLTSLTPQDQQIQGFDVRDQRHAAYAVLNPAIIHQQKTQDHSISIVATGRVYDSLLIPPSVYSDLLNVGLFDQSELWAIVDGKRFQVEDQTSHKPLYVYQNGSTALALHPDGRSAVTAVSLANVPGQWSEDVFAFPTYFSSKKIKSGPQDLTSFGGLLYVAQYSTIDLLSGKIVPLVDAPTAASTLWPVQPAAHFSRDGHFVLLSDAYISPKTHSSVPPCVAVVNLSNKESTCVTPLKQPGERGQAYYLFDSTFIDDNGKQIRLEYLSTNETGREYTTFHRTGADSWQEDIKKAGPGGFDLMIRQDVNTPPVLEATGAQSHLSRVILDPNPQLKNVALVPVTTITWKDDSGRQWKGGLYTPFNSSRDHRYPLLVQTHGFTQNEFNPAGVTPSGFAAQELAAAGILVAQVEETPLEETIQEGQSSVAEVDSLVDKLTSEGLVDSNRVGIVGWSRTCYHVMEELTSGKTNIRAALISDGVNFGYLEFLLTLDYFGENDGGETLGVIGALPFGAGLKTWMERSPEFNLDKVTAPLLAVAYGRKAVLEMWEPYAGLRYLHKPVDLIMLNTDEHTITNPAVRVAAQGGAVDWFRFWLQDYEDPAQEKAAQYKRWRDLRNEQQTRLNLLR